MIDQTLLNDVEQIARNAGSAIMKVYAREFSVEEKEDKSPLTEADKAAHEIIMRGLGSLSLQLPILSEEDAEAFTGVDSDGRYWWMALKSSLSVTVNLPLILR